MPNDRAAWTAYFEGKPPEKQSKYRNVKVEVDGRKYDSKKEAKRASELQSLEAFGFIQKLEYQVRFELVHKQGQVRAVTYVADFTYIENGSLVVEDVKSKATKTAAYRIKRKLMLERHGITIREV